MNIVRAYAFVCVCVCTCVRVYVCARARRCKARIQKHTRIQTYTSRRGRYIRDRSPGNLCAITIFSARAHIIRFYDIYAHAHTTHAHVHK